MTSMTNSMKILIVGFGSIGKRHFDNLVALGYRHFQVLTSQNLTGFACPFGKSLSGLRVCRETDQGRTAACRSSIPAANTVPHITVKSKTKAMDARRQEWIWPGNLMTDQDLNRCAGRRDSAPGSGSAGQSGQSAGAAEERREFFPAIRGRLLPRSG